MKTVIINGQNHKGSSYNIGNILAHKLADDSEITEFFLPRDLNHFCLGCYACMEDLKKCPFYEEKEKIANAMEDGELLIFTSPNYCMMPSAPMKTFIDLFFQYWIPHRPQPAMFKKKAVVISTTAGTGSGKVCADLKRTLSYWGVPYIRKYAIAVQATGWKDVSAKKKEKIEKDMARLAEKVRHATPGKPSPYIRFMFNMMSKAKNNPDDPESEYWKERGWLDGKRPWKNQERR
ncbi:MAG: NAD(P)H-dependent oxidoreductase [Eubacteriaceae bacterium]|nr:NAD(P)H-dependent oxidoreductase [Eubacteriaceae bacterium]